ncbi:MAG: bifunctional 4-hydroxy-2-oxoglutarate aldolase/2-dehydro-3-deoxy-phosphogluconate aldolase [Trueperaceae bacterium]|nr:MAG: bifunctional 4-hydroxy-2-oxoglutarate aldolase/2-dehydro-3-deoxy-phosphogluconate aldolase [Trueperaceae bacterium]
MARFDRLTVYKIMLEDGLVPLYYHPDAAIADRIATSLAHGGSRVLEFLNRGDGAIEVFRALYRTCAERRPEVIVGAGTVEDAPTAALYIAHGANFIVGSTFSEAVARLCNRHKIAYIPGCGTVGEIASAEEWGCEIVKLFPGPPLGPGFVKALLGPRPWTRLLPSGGVPLDEESLQAWFGAGIACIGAGGDLIRKEWLEQGDFDRISELTRTVLARIRIARGTG